VFKSDILASGATVTRINLTVTFTWFALALSVTPLLAHHSVAAEYDMSKTITIQGTVTRVDRMNPHARLWVATKSGDAGVSNWELELPPPATLVRMFARSGVPDNQNGDFFKQGDQLSVTLWRAKDGTMLGHALTIAFPDGRVMNLPRGWLSSDAGSNLTNLSSPQPKSQTALVPHF
jgi:hypothetical protein